jgi:PKHD-type hydroxylase
MNYLDNPFSIDFFTAAECEKIINSATSWIEGYTVGANKFQNLKKVRSVEISKSIIDQEYLDKIFFTIHQLNNEMYGYHIEGFNQLDMPRVYRYSGHREDHYVWHRDIGQTAQTRKLSFSIQLTSPELYQGGRLEFSPTFENFKIEKQGVLTVFPSFLTHRVTSMTAGTRHCIVGWIHGPKFH